MEVAADDDDDDDDDDHDHDDDDADDDDKDGDHRDACRWFNEIQEFVLLGALPLNEGASNSKP